MTGTASARTAPPPQSTRLAVLIPFGIVTTIWGSTWLVIRYQLGVVPPGWSVAYRFALAGAAMLAYALVRRESLRIDARGWGLAAAVGLAQFTINFNFVYHAEQFLTSGLVAVVYALLLVPNAVFARIFLGQRMGRQLLAGSAVAMAGIALLFVNEYHRDPEAVGGTLAGIGLTLTGVVSASTANVLQATETARRYPMATVLGFAMLIGAAADAVLAWATSGPPVIEWTAGYLLGVAYLGIIASAIAFPLYFGVLRVIGPAKAAYSSVLIPVLAMGFSTAFEGYRWSPLAIGGAALTLVGLVLALRARRPNR